jgi:hypothetical protein
MLKVWMENRKPRSAFYIQHNVRLGSAKVMLGGVETHAPKEDIWIVENWVSRWMERGGTNSETGYNVLAVDALIWN